MIAKQETNNRTNKIKTFDVKIHNIKPEELILLINNNHSIRSSHSWCEYLIHSKIQFKKSTHEGTLELFNNEEKEVYLIADYYSIKRLLFKKYFLKPVPKRLRKGSLIRYSGDTFFISDLEEQLKKLKKHDNFNPETDSSSPGTRTWFRPNNHYCENNILELYNSMLLKNYSAKIQLIHYSSVPESMIIKSNFPLSRMSISEIID